MFSVCVVRVMVLISEYRVGGRCYLVVFFLLGSRVGSGERRALFERSGWFRRGDWGGEKFYGSWG